MSGGSYDYSCFRVEEQYVDRMYDRELDDLIRDLVPVLKGVEWWQSGDTSEEDYREDVRRFKAKWMKDTNKRRAALVVNECERLKEELLQSFGCEAAKEGICQKN